MHGADSDGVVNELEAAELVARWWIGRFENATVPTLFGFYPSPPLHPETRDRLVMTLAEGIGGVTWEVDAGSGMLGRKLQGGVAPHPLLAGVAAILSQPPECRPERVPDGIAWILESGRCLVAEAAGLPLVALTAQVPEVAPEAKPEYSHETAARWWVARFAMAARRPGQSLVGAIAPAPLPPERLSQLFDAILAIIQTLPAEFDAAFGCPVKDLQGRDWQFNALLMNWNLPTLDGRTVLTAAGTVHASHTSTGQLQRVVPPEVAMGFDPLGL